MKGFAVWSLACVQVPTYLKKLWVLLCGNSSNISHLGFGDYQKELRGRFSVHRHHIQANLLYRLNLLYRKQIIIFRKNVGIAVCFLE
jgi:hypothetical protein